MTILTNMCLVYDDSNNILLQDRIKNDWPGLNLPGGHIKDNETAIESVRREIKEETNIDLDNIEFVSIYEWFNKETNRRDLTLLYKAKAINKNIISNKEGVSKFYKISELRKENFSLDLDKILDIYGIKLEK